MFHANTRYTLRSSKRAGIVKVDLTINTNRTLESLVRPLERAVFTPLCSPFIAVFVHVLDQFSNSPLDCFLTSEVWFKFGIGLLDLNVFFITCVLYVVFTGMCKAYSCGRTRSVGVYLCGRMVGRLLGGRSF